MVVAQSKMSLFALEIGSTPWKGNSIFLEQTRFLKGLSAQDSWKLYYVKMAEKSIKCSHSLKQ